ncbi:hypothetical protein BGZ95_003307 [Linnemannia exigua]|uniref:Uncharacterized protein n=1 Tax=Linnemannia exigua TaxID=604196 RepID=A0AAD4DHZ9_9FUNG|nr:hypothetical protein BGZ95_003307 [Linnemannia exigua]
MSTYRRHTHTHNLPSSAAASSQAMSGAEMLVLQQSLKQYILTRQSRELTGHEMQEFEKLRSRLLPSLQRYSQSQSTASTPSTSTPVTSRGGGGGGEGKEGGLLRSNSYNTADIVAKRTSYKNSSSSQQGRLATAGLQQQQKQQQQPQQVHQGTSGRSKTSLLYPASSSSAHPVSTTAQKHARTPLSTSSQSRSTVASKPSREPLVKRELSQNTSNIILKPTISTTSTSTPNTSRASTTTKAGQKGDNNNKRPKVSVYQDKENAPTKRRRLRIQAEHESDSDKENRDPLAYTTTPTTPRRTNVLGEKTNFVNNVLNNSAGTKGKDVLRNIVASKIVDMAAATPLAKPRTTKSSHQRQQQQQQQQQQQTRLYPSAHTARVTMVEPPVTEKQVAPTRIVAKADVQQRAVEGDEQPIVTSQSRSSTTKEIDAKGVPTRSESEQGTSHGRLLHNIKQEPVDNVRPDPVDSDRLGPATTPENPAVASSPEKQDHIIRVPETPPRKTAGVSQVPASVEDDDSQGSFERLLKAERAANKSAPRHATAIDYEEVPDSQASQASSDSTASLEETFPMPEFLLEGLPEDPQHDEAEVTLVDADKPNQSNSRIFTTAVPIGRSQSTSQSSRRNSTLQSTAFADGMWCIEDTKHRIIDTVCSFQDQWVALESTSHVQFWRLDEDTPSAKSQWVRYIHLPKTSSRSTQILFAPDDSFAVVMDNSERSFTKLPLQDLDFLRENDHAFPSYAWTGLKPSSGCKGMIVEQDSDGGHMIVVPTEEAGSIGFISVPSDEDRSGVQVMSQVKLATVLGAEARVNSLALIGNTSLVAATFGSNFAVWNVNALEEPVSVVDTALVEPSLVYASVPILFFEEEKMVGMDRSLPATWPILAVFRDRAQSNQCALYAMKDNRIERVHQYLGSSSISSACASSRFIAGHVSANGKDFLQLWNISKPDPVIQLALLEPPSLEEVATRRSVQQQNIWRQQVASAIMQEEVEEVEEKGAENGAKGILDDLDDLFSSVSTLSPPPDDLSSPTPHPSVETEPAAALTEVRTPSPQRRRATVGDGQRQQSVFHQRGSRPPVEWINLTSIAAMERKEVQFSMHTGQQWVVIVQKSAFKKTPSVIHILDLMSILSPSSSPSSSP